MYINVINDDKDKENVQNKQIKSKMRLKLKINLMVCFVMLEISSYFA